jgi:uncharacterized membrane protein
MYNDRPKIKVPFEPLDVIVEIITISLLVLLIIYTFISFQEMPDTVPTHFNAQGEPDSFGSKNMMWLLPGIGLAIYIVFSILNRYPHLHNYNVNITEQNALKNYRLSTRVLRFTLLFIMLLFIYIEYAIISYVNDHSNVFGSWFLPIIIVVSLIIPIFIFIHSKKMNRT